jgi:hypothetical protein
MANNYLSRLTAIEYRRFAGADDTVWDRDPNWQAVLSLRSTFRDKGEFFDIGEVAQASNLKLVFDEVGFGDKWDM